MLFFSPRVFQPLLFLHLCLFVSDLASAVDYRAYAHAYSSWNASLDDPQQHQWGDEEWSESPSTGSGELSETDTTAYMRLLSRWDDLWQKRRLFFMANVMEYAAGRGKKGSKKPESAFKDFYRSFPSDVFESEAELRSCLLILESNHQLDSYPDAIALRTYLTTEGGSFVKMTRLAK